MLLPFTEKSAQGDGVDKKQLKPQRSRSRSKSRGRSVDKPAFALYGLGNQRLVTGDKKTFNVRTPAHVSDS